MKARIAMVVLAAVLNSPSNSICSGQAVELITPTQLRQEMIRHLPVLERSFGAIQGKCSFQEEIDNEELRRLQQTGKTQENNTSAAGRQVIEIHKISFAIAGEHRKCDLVSSINTSEGKFAVGQSNRSKTPERRVFCMGPRGSFSLRWMKLDDSPEIKEFAAANSSIGPGYEEYVGVPLRAPVSIFTKRLVDLLHDPNFKFDRIEPVDIDGQNCMRVFFNWIRPPQEAKGKPARKLAPLIGSFVTDPGMGFALRSCEYHAQDKPRINFTANIEYQPRNASEDQPLPKRVEIIFGANHRTMTIEQLTRTTVPDSEFTLSAYGLPEIDRPVGDVNRNAMAYWLGGSAVALLGLAGWLRYRSPAKVGQV